MKGLFSALSFFALLSFLHYFFIYQKTGGLSKFPISHIRFMLKRICSCCDAHLSALLYSAGTHAPSFESHEQRLRLRPCVIATENENNGRIRDKKNPCPQNYTFGLVVLVEKKKAKKKSRAGRHAIDCRSKVFFPNRQKDLSRRHGASLPHGRQSVHVF